MSDDISSRIEFDDDGEHVSIHFGTIWTDHPEADAVGTVEREDRDGRHWRRYSSSQLNQAIKIAERHKRAAERALRKLKTARRQLGA